MKESELRIDHLILGLAAGAIASFILFSCVNNELALMLTIFNFLFVSLTFPLNGTLPRKMLLLSMGNIIGLLWNYTFSSFAATVAIYSGEFFNALYIILNPFFNLIWIVSFWSLSLTVLANSRKRIAEAET